MSPCFSPRDGFVLSDGSVVFDDVSSRRDIVRRIKVPCRQCIGCRAERSEMWATRCEHEASMHGEGNSSFVTFTVDPKHMERIFPRQSVRYPPYQLLMRRAQHELGRTIRHYMCAEYGSEGARPHYHALWFGTTFADQQRWQKNRWGDWTYRSASLERLWPFGHCVVGPVNHASARYVAGYCTKLITGDLAKQAYARVDDQGPYQVAAPFSNMSTHPGIGASWLLTHLDDVYKVGVGGEQLLQDGVLLAGGHQLRAPVYYDRLLKRVAPDLYQAVKAGRELRGWEAEQLGDHTPERLGAREEVLRARLQWRKRD